MENQNKNNRKKIVTITVIVLGVLLIAGGAFAAHHFITQNDDTEPVKETTTIALDWVENYDYNQTTSVDANVYEEQSLPPLTLN